MLKAQDLSATRQWRGVIHASVTRLERRLNTLEAKNALTSSDLLAVERLLKKEEALDIELKEHRYTVIDLAAHDEHVLDKEHVSDKPVGD